MSAHDDERRWKMIEQALAAEVAGRELRPTVSQRTLFGIPSSVEVAIERIVAEDEADRREKRARRAEGR